MFLYTIDTGYVCFCLEVDNGIVIHAPGMAKWALGKNWCEVEEHFKNRNANIKKTKL